MTRDPKIYDVAVLGGGIAGAAVALEARRRGLSVLLLEKNTFGSGASSKSSKLIHGGLRYLETSWRALKRLNLYSAWRNLTFVFRSLDECRKLEAAWPDLIRPIPIVLPVYGNRHRHRFSVYAGVLLYYLLARLSGPARKPSIFWDAKVLTAKMPGLNPKGLRGGVLFWDRLVDDRRLVQAIVRAATDAGADVHEHVEAAGYRQTPDDAYEIDALRESGLSLYRARRIVNASGAWIDQIRRRTGDEAREYVYPVAGSHLTVKKFLPWSVLLEAADGRLFFVINIGDTARVGTTERVCETPDDVRATPGEVDYLLKSLRFYFPEKKFGEEDILTTDAGIRPLARPSSKQAAADILRDHEIRTSTDGVYHLPGVKLTDHRRAAEEMVVLLMRSIKPSRSSSAG